MLGCLCCAMSSFAEIRWVVPSWVERFKLRKNKRKEALEMNEIIENKKKSEILAENLNELSYGDFISHEQIASVIEETYGTNKYASTISKAKKILLKKYNKAIECVIGDGYRLVSPDNFVQQSLKHYKRGFTEIGKAHDTLEYAPVQDMTPEGRDTYRRVYDRAITLQAAMRGASVELKTLAGKRKHPFALENMQND